MSFYLILFLLCLKVPFVHNSIFSLAWASSAVEFCTFTFQIQSFPKAKTKKFRLNLPLHLLLSVTLLLYIPAWFTSLNHPVSKPPSLSSCFLFCCCYPSTHPPTVSPSPIHPHLIYLYISFRASAGAESMKNLSGEWTVSGQRGAHVRQGTCWQFTNGSVGKGRNRGDI